MVNNKKKEGNLASKYFVNDQIKAREVIVIDHEGQNLGTIPTSQAYHQAQDVGMDLVQVGTKDNVPVTKFMDFGKFLYIKKKQMHDAKKHHKVIHIKEIKMRPNIGDGDYQTKLRKASEFFRDGKKVKFTLQFKGREVTMMNDLGPRFFDRIAEDIKKMDLGSLQEEKDSRSHMYWSKIFAIK
ncbi:MAG: translation initiation factor IF-3 [Epsilonproteobacteria bacterium]|nr:translation initiation factor IF-3 [Campylobacterota bacterium]